MPAFRLATCAASIAAALWALCVPTAVTAQQTPDAPTEAPGDPAAPVVNSSLDGSLFFQLLVGELELRSGEAGAAYQVLLDAARRSNDEGLFRRAIDIALRARAGDQALAAARAWRTAVPESREAHEYIVQLLMAMGRLSEVPEPLRSLLELTPAADRPGVIASLPRLLARANDKRLAAGVLEDLLQAYRAGPVQGTDARVSAIVATGRGWLNAGDSQKALGLARQAQGLDSTAEGPALLGLELMGGTPEAESLVTSYLQVQPAGHTLRMAYVRRLMGAQRYADAVSQLQVLTRQEPGYAAAWLSLGALQLELKRPREAEAALQRYVNLLPPSSGASAEPPAEGGKVEEGSVEASRTQAYLLLAQAAEQRNDYKAAEAWLGKIDSPSSALTVLSRRASLLARQGKLADARQLIRKSPERNEDDARAKLLAEAQLLREMRQWREAHAVLADALKRSPDNVDLLYEQAMMSEKLDRMTEMESLLRRVMELRPDYHHAYNALGYSLADRNQRLPEARELIAKALELSPGDPFITDSLGWVEYRLGNSAEALRLLKQAYQAQPDTEIAAHLGEVLWALGQRDEARKVWREGRDKDAGNEVLKSTLARLKVDL
ncbi:tetratricopeptide repeat protein [Methylibium rhizosphaerae]|uniref:tetratricopeptide repeat protein n=1 Tax=Methylibium rhizosphaerae TaxID=2570323 RepID=UPI00112665DE|nr:tetratricopeptide repeat protein [Methylibium rhizosphaerae]